ncbi:MFS transporter [Rhizosaccharibacter radicis]|uniref:MFS transporter n=1 Tax=Rhizosaccharibacter radicis TaxID=2782605 RepID=A0ABT1VWN1_9PROT|nr:MFS transporter [Acetobacteraceae bacterium KSS12]
MKMLVALAGVVIAAMSTELNDAVSGIILNDILGGLGISHDPGTWVESLYITGEVVGMSCSPWFAITFGLRRWTLFVICFACVTTLLIPTTANLTLLYVLRVLQGLSGGLTIPLLMTTALRALPPPIRLYGLAAYALTATFFPNLSTLMAALWTEAGDGPLGWQFSFYEALPLATIAALLVWYGMVVDPPQLQRFRKFDWRGLLLVMIGLGSLTTVLQQGDRYDWFKSTTICLLTLSAAVAIPLLLINEWFHELPLLKLQMLGRRNLAYGLIGLFTFLIVTSSSSSIPISYLEQVQDFRPLQAYGLTTLVACMQLVLLPAMALLLNIKSVDPRVVSFLGLACVLTACIGNTFLTDVWKNGEFWLWQVFQGFGEAMIVMPLLLMATNTVKKPEEGPFASSLVNTPRALGEATSTWLLQLITRWRGDLHSSRLTDQAGQERYRAVQGHGVLPNDPPPLLPNGQPRTPDSMIQFIETIRHETTVLTLSDAFALMGAITVGLMVVLIVLTERTYPPRIVFAKK